MIGTDLKRGMMVNMSQDLIKDQTTEDTTAMDQSIEITIGTDPENIIVIDLEIKVSTEIDHTAEITTVIDHMSKEGHMIGQAKDPAEEMMKGKISSRNLHTKDLITKQKITGTERIKSKKKLMKNLFQKVY